MVHPDQQTDYQLVTNENPPDKSGGFCELKKWVKLSLKNKALRHRQKIFTTNNHYEWSKNQSCRICHDLTLNPSPPDSYREERGTGAISYHIQNETEHLKFFYLNTHSPLSFIKGPG
jgi:hypothetical protein